MDNIREQFPILKEKARNGNNLIYFDSAATTLKPLSVIDRIFKYYKSEGGNVSRGSHFLSEKSTESYEEVRIKVANFISAKHTEEIIFTSGVTESINLVANTYGELLEEGNEIIISMMEHNANIVPWQFLRERKKIVIKIAPIDKDGNLMVEELKKLFNEKTKLLSLTYISNSIGTINPIKEIISYSHQRNVDVLIDAAQASTHEKIDVIDLDVDFLVFSGHKSYGPTGVGVLYGKKEKLSKLPPYKGGGGMVLKVTHENTKYNELPHKFEAGTPNIAGIIGFGAAIDFINEIGIDKIKNHENQLKEYMEKRIIEVESLKIIGSPKEKIGIFSFVMEEIHGHDVSAELDENGIAVRSGHHCTHPLMDFFQVPSTNRVSFGVYNTLEEIDIFIKSLKNVVKIFG